MAEDGLTLVRLDAAQFTAHAREIERIEEASYEPSRRDSTRTLASIAADPRGVSHLVTLGGSLVGFSFAGPLERFAEVEGVRADASFGEATTLYAADLTVAPAYRGHGAARVLKEAQILGARGLGYRFVAGRNRVGLADAMWALNVSLGARELLRIDGAYPDGPAPRAAVYYRITLDEGPEDG